MAKLNAPYTNFNGGEVGPEIQGRINLEGYAATASILENWLPEAEGPMGNRPGFEFKVQPVASDTFVLLHPFKYSVSQKALLCFSGNELRIAQDGAIVSRGSVSAAIANSSFSTSGATNLAINTPTAGQAVAAGTLAALIDGNASNGMTSGATATQTFTFDLGSPQTPNVMEIWGPLSGLANAPRNFYLEGSATGAFSGEQTLIIDIVNEVDWKVAERRSFTFAAATFRYFRLSITRRSDDGSGSYMFNEVRFHGANWGDSSVGVASVANANTAFLGQLFLSSERGGRAAVTGRGTTANVGAQHALIVEVTRGPVSIRIGTTRAGSDLLEFVAGTGYHSVAFVPTAATFYIEIFSTEVAHRLVGDVAISGPGDLILPTPWATGVLRSLRFVQSGDIVYVASGVGRMKRIERRSAASWSIVDTDERDGPFLGPNLDPSYTLTANGTSGNVTVTSSLPMFSQGHVGALFELTHTGQTVADAISNAGGVTQSIVVRGIDNDRIFRITIAGTWTGTLALQRSVGNDTSFADTGTTYTSNQSNIAFDDGFDNQTIYYRFRASAWTSGTATITITYSGGTTVGVIRVVTFSSSSVVTAEVVKALGATSATSDWQEGAWSDVAYWPRAVALFDGRLWTGAEDRIWGSVSDAYESHEAGDFDANAISRNIATGDVNPMQWILSLSRLVFGTEGAEVVGRESTQDGLITPANLTLREFGTNGSADVAAIKVDTQGISVDRSTWRALLYAFDVDTNNYVSSSLMRLHRNLGKPGILQLAVSRQPETRLWMVRADGVLLTKSFTPGEAVLGWSRIITDGEIESVAVLPGDAGVGEDEIWVMVSRTINGTQKRYLEKMANYYYDTAAEANRLDSSVVYEGTPKVTFDAPHLRGRTVGVWSNGARLADKVVDLVSGQFTIAAASGYVVYGLNYTARYQSSKLALGAQGGTALGQPGKVINVLFGLIGSVRNLEYADNFDKMDPLRDRPVTGSYYDTGPGLFDGQTDKLTCPNKAGNDRDPRLCLRSESQGGPIRLAYFVAGFQGKERIG